MAEVPAQPKIYHITHIDNLDQILSDQVLWSEAQCHARRINCHVVGMSEIKQRRLEEMEVRCHPGTRVGQYVPFYFCPRSIMLYLLHMGNHPSITYRGGQEPILHLEADLNRVVQWANQHDLAWAFTDRNAGDRLVNFYNDLSDLDRVNWTAVASINFRDMLVKVGKQAEFLMFRSFPWKLVDKIGVISEKRKDQVEQKLQNFELDEIPVVSVERSWYY